MPDPSDGAARSIVRRLLNCDPHRVEPYRPPSGGNDSHSFLIWTDEAKRLLKIKRRPGSPIGIYFYGRLKDAGLPVPELMAFSPNAGPNGEACAIWEWIDGESAEWDVGEPCPYDAAEFGGLLKCIHNLEFDGAFGLLGDDLAARSFTWHSDLGPVSDTWSGFFHCGRAAQRHFDSGILNRSEADILSNLPGCLSGELDLATPRLLHMGDIMHNGNMIVDSASRHILAVVDYVESMVGDPRLELAWVDYYFLQLPSNRVTFDMDRFRAAYGTDHDPDDPLGRFYLAVILMLGNYSGPASPRSRWSVDTMKSILRDFGSS